MGCAAAGQNILHWLWPETCAHCREDLPKDNRGPLCLRCRLRLIPYEPSRLTVDNWGACSRVCSPFLYREAAISVVHAFKFRGRRGAARAAGSWMGQAWPRFPQLGRPDALVPMPLHPGRRRERGYNQALLIAEALSVFLGIEVQEPVKRLRRTRPQWALSREQRRENLKNAFFCACEAVKGKRLLLIDDVCTSGASLETCAQALKAAGAASVFGYVFARQTAGALRENG
ncbi:MAG: hypothetical protein A3J74_11320 [Elusimicrobia bacterium RIFCSPHIGHO2_02_FULL_57_9]|nr:MAG: hypothetical protein A3J74_11320 [Elusimicrobia bacterium RIFCSPHIGHO2_02_FULL_57_9]